MKEVERKSEPSYYSEEKEKEKSDKSVVRKNTFFFAFIAFLVKPVLYMPINIIEQILVLIGLFFRILVEKQPPYSKNG